jgi:hypothetical protein
MPNGPLRHLVPLALAALAILAMPIAARADDGDDSRSDVRVELSCSARSTMRLRVRTRDDDQLRVELDVRTPRRGTAWSVVMVHERRLVLRSRSRTGGSSGSFSLRRTLPDWPGRDTVTVRANGPGGETCRATATVDGD